MVALVEIFGDLVAHQLVRAGEELPALRPGITWLWGANGIFKRGVDARRDILIRVAPTPPTPGLAELRPHVRFLGVPGPIPTSILDQVLLHARCMRAIEQQYFVAWSGEAFAVLLPPQEATAVRVAYTLPAEVTPLVDLHSHHHMDAYFSRTDDRDDTGLSVSGVIGRLNTDQPQIILRANVYGHRQLIPLEECFAGCGLFTERSYGPALSHH